MSVVHPTHRLVVQHKAGDPAILVALGIPSQDINRPNGGHVFAAHKRETFTDQLVFDATEYFVDSDHKNVGRRGRNPLTTQSQAQILSHPDRFQVAELADAFGRELATVSGAFDAAER